MKNFIFLVIILLSQQIVIAQQNVSHFQIPTPTGIQVEQDPDIKNLVWNRRSTENFVILSLNDDQGRYLQTNIENMKDWVASRWGLPSEGFPSSKLGEKSEPGCMVLCVPNKTLMKKLFNLEESYGEVVSKDGKIEKRFLWLVLDGTPAETIPPALTMVCLSQVESDYNYNFGFWAVRGMSVLNSTIPNIKTSLKKVNPDLQNGNMFSVTREDYKKMSPEKRKDFDGASAMACLLLRKEFGQKNLLDFFRNPNTEENFKMVYGFQNFDHLNQTFKRYSKNLITDISNGVTPNSYLQIMPIKYK
jgi:hypothetical protein